jgi:ribosomal protein S18 acetylase RimI-like enzyme
MTIVEIPDELLGRRVSLRHRVGERAGRPLFSDAVGELAADGPGVLLVSTRRGPVRVSRSAVVAVREIPAAVPRRASLAAVARLETLCADAWPALTDRPLGEWRLRAAGGFTGRANAALAVGNPGRPVEAALRIVQEFAAEHGIPARVHAPIGSPWDRAVAGAGWRLATEHAAGPVSAVLVAPLTGNAGPRQPPSAHPIAPSPGPDPRVELLGRPDPRWWDLGPADPPTPAQRAVIDPGGPMATAFPLLVGSEGESLGHLRAAVVADHLHLSQLAVAAPARRRGLGRALVGAAVGWARDRGARWAVLQVAVHNVDALAFYERLGFVEHHRYRYLAPP